jgi:predicted AlkP superfamily phosphohydrolase/phosphomutase
MALRRPRKKAVLIGLDAAMLEYWDRYIAEGRCPNIARLLREGASADAYSAPPPATAVNWNTIATGCYAGGHGVHGMNFRTMGAPITAPNVSAFDARYRTAEPLWDANERGGGSSLLLRYTCTWPPTLTRGVQVDGHGHPGANLHQVSQRHAWATYPLAMPPAAKDNGLTPYASEISLRPGAWANTPDGVRRTLEADITLKLSRGHQQQPLSALLVDYGNGQGFSEVRINARRDWEGSVGAGPGEWTAFLTLPVKLYPPAHEWDPRDGNGPVAARYFLRFKVMELAPDGSRFKLYAPGSFPDYGWTVPDGLCATLVQEIGPYVETAGIGAPFRSGWTDAETFLEECEQQVAWLSAAARYLMPRTEWDLFMAQLHITDHAGHSMLGHTDPESYYFNPDLQEACTRGYRRAYELADQYVGAILEHVPDDATVMVVSDHGMYPVRLPVVDVNKVLAEAGLYAPGGDPAQSKAAWFYESQIRINVRGRDEGGIVEPGAEYEAVRDQVIRALEEYRDPLTAERVFQLVVRSEDAQMFGWYGERVGDICYLQKPRLSGKGPGPQTRQEPVSPGETEAGGRRAAARMLPGNGEHHYYWQMPARSDGSAPGGRAMFIVKAPGVRRGYRRPAPVELVDAAPTLAYVSGIPVPRHSEGRIRQDLFEEELF